MTLRTFLCLSLFTASGLIAQQGDHSDYDVSRPPPEWEIPPAPVLTAEEALETFILQPGFRIELVASEPLIHDPVAIDFDEDGRIWVVEMQSYMPNVDGEGEIAPVSRVVVLEDTNGDGRMDQNTAYLDNLILPRSIRVVAGGVLVGEPPHLWFTRDTDGDLRADEKISIYDNYSRQDANPEHGANGLLVGLDNWIHNAMFDGGRFRLVNGEWIRSPALTRGQWGISQDDTGRIFTNANPDHLRVDLVPNHYHARNRNLPSRRGIIPGSLGGVYEQVVQDQKVWPARINAGVNRRVHLRDDGYLDSFTAACAPLIYRGDALPEEFRGNAFIAEPAAHFIRRTIIEENADGILSGQNAYHEDEFLASTDERFRPVNLYTAPDGTLYLVDMYRGILQHRQFVTTYLRRQIEERGLEEPLGLGRIYRIVHESAEPGPAPRLSEARNGELVEHLSHPNGWWRDTAQRLLVERGDAAVAPALDRLAREGENETGRLHALWTLEGIGALKAETLVEMMRESSPVLRAHGVRLAEPFLRDGSPEELLQGSIQLLLGDSAPVRLQAALSLGELPPSGQKQEVLARVLQAHADQPFLIEAVLSGLQDQEMEFIRHIASQAEWAEERPRYAPTLAALAGAVMRSGREERINGLIEFTLSDGVEIWQQLAVLDGIQSSRARELTSRPEALDQTAAHPEVAERAETVFANLEWPEDEDADREVTAEVEALVAKGADAYQLNCSACHQSDGQGMAGLAAPLVDSQWVLGKEENLIRIVLHGKAGEMTMPPLGGALDDETIAAILSYIRRAWGHEEEPVQAEKVGEVREAYRSREEPWSPEELEAQ